MRILIGQREVATKDKQKRINELINELASAKGNSSLRAKQTEWWQCGWAIEAKFNAFLPDFDLQPDESKAYSDTVNFIVGVATRLGEGQYFVRGFYGAAEDVDPVEDWDSVEEGTFNVHTPILCGIPLTVTVSRNARPVLAFNWDWFTRYVARNFQSPFNYDNGMLTDSERARELFWHCFLLFKTRGPWQFHFEMDDASPGEIERMPIQLPSWS